LQKINDLRPITLINNLCKIAEAIFIRRIEVELNEIKFFSDIQYGFKKNSSTIDALKEIVKEIKNAKTYKFGAMIALVHPIRLVGK
jgi:hypothetical protein